MSKKSKNEKNNIRLYVFFLIRKTKKNKFKHNLSFELRDMFKVHADKLSY